jgi:hypothetical protein
LGHVRLLKRHPPKSSLRTASEAILGRQFCFLLLRVRPYVGRVTVDTFKPELNEAVKAFDKYIVCLEKTRDQFEKSLISLLHQAIKAYETRGPNLRHGIALDRQVTIILSQTEEDRPLCGIYFNLHTPYHKQIAAKTAAAPKQSPEPKG